MGVTTATLPRHTGAGRALGFGRGVTVCPGKHCCVVSWDTGHGTCHSGQRLLLYAPALQQQLKHHEIITWWLQPLSQYIIIFKSKFRFSVFGNRRKTLKTSKCRDNTEILPFLKPCKIQDEGLGVQCQLSLLRYCL